MNTKTLAVLSIAAAAAVLGAVLVEGRSRPTSEAAAAGAPLLPDLKTRVNDVAHLSVNRAGDVMTFRRSGEAWELVERGGFPAQADKVRSTLIGLTQLRAAEQMTSKPEHYPRLGVQDPAPAATAAESPESSPTLLTLKDAQDQTVASVIIGNSKWGAKSGVYARRAGEAQSWFAEGQLELPVGIAGWTDTKIIDLMRDRIRAVSLLHADGEVVSVSRATPEQVNFTIDTMEPGKELKSPAAGDSLGAILSWVNFDDVRPLAAIDFSAPATTAEFHTFDGVVITILIAEQEGQTWAQFAAAYDQSVTPPESTGLTQLLSPADARKQAEDLQARWGRWAYQIPSWKALSFRTRMTEFYKDTPPAMPASMEGVESIDPSQFFQPPPLPSSEG